MSATPVLAGETPPAFSQAARHAGGPCRARRPRHGRYRRPAG